MKTFFKALALPLALVFIALIEIAALIVRLYRWVYEEWADGIL